LQPGGHRFDPGQLHQKFCLQEIMMTVMRSITDLGIWLVPIAAFVVYGVVEVTKLVLRHQERIAKIERGIDPDAHTPQQK
jgi:hypothetical protein